MKWMWKRWAGARIIRIFCISLLLYHAWSCSQHYSHDPNVKNRDAALNINFSWQRKWGKYTARMIKFQCKERKKKRATEIKNQQHIHILRSNCADIHIIWLLHWSMRHIQHFTISIRIVFLPTITVHLIFIKCDASSVLNTFCCFAHCFRLSITMIFFFFFVFCGCLFFFHALCFCHQWFDNDFDALPLKCCEQRHVEWARFIT